MATKKRIYSDDYMTYGFTSIIVRGVEQPQCVICMKVLPSESMKPNKMKRHLEAEHPHLKDNDRAFFQSKADVCKRRRLDDQGDMHTTSKAAIEASYIVAYRVAQMMKPHTIAEELILPCLKDVVRTMLGVEQAKKLSLISLSNNTIQRRISSMSTDIKSQVVEELKMSSQFVLQMDESTDVTAYAQLLVYIRYIHQNDFKGEFLFCHSLTTQTRGIDIFDTLMKFFLESNYKIVFSVCENNFVITFQKQRPITIHSCAIHSLLMWTSASQTI